MKRAKKVKKAKKTEPINLEIMQVDRMQAITNLSLAILETARALNTPSVMVKHNTFVGGSPALNILQRENK